MRWPAIIQRTIQEKLNYQPSYIATFSENGSGNNYDDNNISDDEDYYDHQNGGDFSGSGQNEHFDEEIDNRNGTRDDLSYPDSGIVEDSSIFKPSVFGDGDREIEFYDDNPPPDSDQSDLDEILLKNNVNNEVKDSSSTESTNIQKTSPNSAQNTPVPEKHDIPKTTTNSPIVPIKTTTHKTIISSSSSLNSYFTILLFIMLLW